MRVKFLCVKCKHKLKANADQAGKPCKCTRCGNVMMIPSAAEGVTPWYSRPPRLIAAAIGGLVAVGGLIALIVFLANLHPVHGKVDDVKNGTPRQRAAALEWLAEADPVDADRHLVTTTLEGPLCDGDLRGGLDSDLLLRTYLHWADANNLDKMIQIVKNPDLPEWTPQKTGMVLKAIGKLAPTLDDDHGKQRRHAYELLAQKLADPNLGADAQSALESAGRGAGDYVTPYLFDADAKTRERAQKLLGDYGTHDSAKLAAALEQLQSKSLEAKDAKCVAAHWLATGCEPGAKTEKSQQNDVATALAAQLDDISSAKLNGEALAALRVWGTKEILPKLGDFARRQVTAEPSKRSEANNKNLIDLLVSWKDPIAAEDIAVYLQDPSQRERAVQALLQLDSQSPGVAKSAVLHHINDPDEGARKDAAKLCSSLKISDDDQLEQTLTDLNDKSKDRVDVALRQLANLRTIDASRTKIAKALNAPLNDADERIRDDALAAVRVWGTADNTEALVKMLGTKPIDDKNRERARRRMEKVADSLITIGPVVEDSVAPLVKSPDPLIRYMSARILGEVGTAKSLKPLQEAVGTFGLDTLFVQQAEVSMQKIDARK